jgi:ammonia channel protein AmtB
VLGIVVCVIWVGGVTFCVMKVVDSLFGNRARVEDERGGLDVPEMGIEGYGAEPSMDSGVG